MYKNFHELIISNFNLEKQSSRGWYSLSCPVCGDRKKRAGFKFTDHGFGYNCFRGSCGHKVRYEPTYNINDVSHNIAVLFRAIGLKDTDWDYLLYESSGDYKPLEIPKSEIIIDPIEIKLPFGARKLLDANPANAVVEWSIDYLLKRGVDPENQTFYVTTVKPAKDELDFRSRLIIPFYYKSKLIFYQGAWVHPTWKTNIKYLNTNLVERESIFYNMDELDRNTNDPLFVVEGAFDANWFQNSVGTLSNTLTEQQILRLNKCKRRKIIIPDNDKAGAKIIQLAIDYNWDVSWPDWYGVYKDLDDAIRHYGIIRAAQEIMKEIRSTDFEKELVIGFLNTQ